MSRGRRSGRLAFRMAFLAGLCTLAGMILMVYFTIQNFAPHLADDAESGLVRKAWTFGAIFSLVVSAIAAVAVYLRSANIGTRLTDLGLAVSKLGRGGTEVRVRISGNDEVTALGRALQYLSSDLTQIQQERDAGGGQLATMDPQVRAFRDLALDEEMEQTEGFEVDGAVCAGERGGMDYYGCVHQDERSLVFVVSGEGTGPIAVLACRRARDELIRAFKTGAGARKALSHTNRVLFKQMPRGACAKASLLELKEGEAKLYQAGYRAPLWICSAGQVHELNADGLALGLDEGPVFEKGLKPEKIPLEPGVRLVQTNEAGMRLQAFLDLVQTHSPKHSVPFMNLTLGGLEDDAEGGLREDVLLLTAKRC